MGNRTWRLRAGSLCCLLALAAAPFGACGQTPGNVQYGIQAGAFSTEPAAQAFADELKTRGFADAAVRVAPDELVPGRYKVVAATAGSRTLAEQIKLQLVTAGYDGFILKPAGAAVASELADLAPRSGFFKETTPSLGSHKLDTQAMMNLAASDGGESTSLGKVREMHAKVQALPNDHPAKGRWLLNLARRGYAGKAPGRGQKPDDYGRIKSDLMRVANGQVAACPEDLRAARMMVARMLHYGDQDKLSALRAYRDVLADAQSGGDRTAACQARTQMAAVIFEESLQYGLDLAAAQDKLALLYQDNRLAETQLEDTGLTVPPAVRTATCRIGLMLSEIGMLLKQWDATLEFVSSLIEVYEPQPNCMGEVAEAYCHKARCLMKKRDKAGCYAAADKAIDLGHAFGKPVWGDPRRDVVWKAYNWKTYAMKIVFKEPRPVVAAMKAAVAAEFPNHEALADYLRMY